MLLKSVDLHNIRSYDKLHLEFPPGYVLLEGDVGSGKSTILMAIEFALFGLGTVRADSLLSKRERRGEVVLAFEVDGVEYEVGRTLTAKDGKVTQDPKGSYFLAGDTREPLTASDLKARVLQVLKFREPANPRSQSRVYRYAVYTPQEEIKSILEASGREDVIRRAFGVEDYKTAADNADTLRTQIKGKKDELTGRFAKLEAHRAEREAVGSDVDALERDLARLHQARDDLAGGLAEAESRRAGMASRMEDLVRIRAEADQTEKDIANKKESMKKLLENMQTDRAELDGVGERLQELGRPAKPTDKTQGDVQKLLDMVEETERRIHAKRSEEKACVEAVAGIVEKMAQLDRPAKPTDKTQGDVQKLLDMVEETERRIHAKRSEEKACVEAVAGIVEKMAQLDRPAKPTDKTQGDVQKLLDMVEETERRIHAKRSEEKACVEAVAGMDKELGGKSHAVIRDAIASIVERIRSGTRALSSAEQDLREHNTGIGAKRNEIKTLEDGLRKAEGLGARCEYCDSALAPEYVVKLHRDRKGRLVAAKSELDSIDVEMAKVRHRLEDISKQLDDDRILLEKCSRDESVSEQRSTQEARLESLRADLAYLDPEAHVPADEPLARNSGEPPRDYLRRLLDSLREYESAADKMRDMFEQRSTQEARLESLRADLAYLDPEAHVPADEPLARNSGEPPRDYLRRLLDSLREYESAADKMRDMFEQRSTQEARLESLRADLAYLDPEAHVPADEPLARNSGEPPRDYLRRLLDSLREYESAADKIATLTQHKTRLESRMTESEKEYQQDEIYLQQREASIVETRARLEGYDVLEQDIRAAETECVRIRSDLEQTNSKASVIGERIRNKRERADQLDADIKEAEGHLLRHNMYRDHEEWLKGYFVPSVCRMERYVMESLRYDFNESYGEWYSLLVDDPTKTSRIDEKFAPVLEQDGYEQNVESLSGGEKTSVALAYRLAINSTMRRQADILKSNLLILDEPTDGFSREQMEKVREILDSLRSEQIIMVSHERELEGFVEHVFRVTKSEGSSSVRKIK